MTHCLLAQVVITEACKLNVIQTLSPIVTLYAMKQHA